MTHAPRGPKHSHTRNNERKTEAAARLEARSRRSNEDQLRLINERPGNSSREKARLA